jgi:hypothetical protein
MRWNKIAEVRGLMKTNKILQSKLSKLNINTRELLPEMGYAQFEENEVLVKMYEQCRRH